MFCRFFTIFLLILSSIALSAQDQVRPRLSLDAIHQEMEKIFSQHLTKKKMTGEIIGKALVHYIDQFDPRHVYLLQEDVKPFLSISRYRLERLAEDYQNKDYTIFEKLNTVIQHAVRKLRHFRRSTVVDADHFNKLSARPLPLILPEKRADIDSFAENEVELDDRHAIYLAYLVRQELDTLKALRRPSSLLEAVRVVELELEEFENGYLYLDKRGMPLDAQDKEEAFAFHILKALTASLDVHSAFLNPKEAQSLRMKLEKHYVGVGLYVASQGGSFIVSSMIKGSPAEQSGKIQIGDELVRIGQAQAKNVTSQEVEEMLHGEANTYVDLGFKRTGTAPFHVVLERREVTLQEGRVDTSFEKYAGGIVGVVQLHAFYEGEGSVSSEKDVRHAIETLKKQGALKGLVLDLRDNRGGFLMQAVKVAGLFIKTGVVVAAKYSDGSLHYFRDTEPGVISDGPVIVLTSRETASAAEIVAEALKDYGVGIVVGDEQTYGKGSIQMQTVTKEKESESYFKVTIGRYYSVSGRSTQLEGVKADIVVPGNLSEKKIGEEYLSETIKSDTIEPSFDDTLSDVPEQDKVWYQQYYVPFLQQKSDTYRKWIPELAKRSKARLSKNKNYQNLLHGDYVVTERKGLINVQTALDPEAALRAIRNMQLQEAIAITKDLIELAATKSSNSR